MRGQEEGEGGGGRRRGQKEGAGREGKKPLPTGGELTDSVES